MKALKKLLLYVAIPLSVLAAAMAGCNVGQYRTPEYTVQQAVRDDIELRLYAPALAAEAVVTGERKEAITIGFRMLADYIFGNNADARRIAMTVPVLQQSADRQTTPTPALQQAGESGTWRIRFTMPAEYTRDTLPAPTNPQIKIIDAAPRQMAVIRFAGSTRNDHRIGEKIAELEAYILTNHLRSKGAPVLAFYDPPWTPASLRRNEVMLEVVAAPAKKATKKR